MSKSRPAITFGAPLRFKLPGGAGYGRERLAFVTAVHPDGTVDLVAMLTPADGEQAIRHYERVHEGTVAGTWRR